MAESTTQRHALGWRMGTVLALGVLPALGCGGMEATGTEGVAEAPEESAEESAQGISQTRSFSFFFMTDPHINPDTWMGLDHTTTPNSGTPRVIAALKNTNQWIGLPNIRGVLIAGDLKADNVNGGNWYDVPGSRNFAAQFGGGYENVDATTGIYRFSANVAGDLASIPYEIYEGAGNHDFWGWDSSTYWPDCQGSTTVNATWSTCFLPKHIANRNNRYRNPYGIGLFDGENGIATTWGYRRTGQLSRYVRSGVKPDANPC